MSRHVRVSEWAVEELSRRAAAEGRSVVSVVDRLLGRPTPVVATDERSGHRAAYHVSGAGVVDVVGESVGASAARCPKCGCASSVHGAGDSGVRCEQHPNCRWSH